jgi:flagellin
MSSIMTNASAMTALQTLRKTNSELQTTQSRISTGYRVAEASDNAAYWSIATTMRSDNKALSTVKDALGLGAAKVDTAYTGMNSAISVVDEIKAKLVAAREPGVDRNKIQAEISQLQGQLEANASATSFTGENWLSVDSTAPFSFTRSIVSAFTRATDGSISIGTIEINIGSTILFDAGAEDNTGQGVGILDAKYTSVDLAGPPPYVAGDRVVDQTMTGATLFTVHSLDISALTNSDADVATLEAYIKGVDNALSRMTTAASDLGAAKKRVDLQSTFVTNLMDAIDRGVGQLVDADMNKESTRLQALQVQQQLGIQALTIANSNSQSIMALFRS